MSTHYEQNVNIAPSPLVRGGLVPVEPKPTAKPQKTFVPLSQFLLNTGRYIDGIDQSEELDHQRMVVKLRKFYIGDQIGSFSQKSNEPLVWKRRGKDAPLYVDPQMSFHVDTNLAQIVKSRPQIDVLARSPEQVNKTEAARYAKALYEDFQRDMLKASFMQREGKHLLLGGEAYRNTYFSREVEGTEVRVPVSEQKTVEPSVSIYECPYCDHADKLDAATKGAIEAGAFPCPECGYERVSIVAGEPFEASVVTGYKDVPAGDVFCESPDPLEMKASNYAYTIKDSPYLTRDRLIMRGVLETVFKRTDIPSSTIPIRLQWQKDLKNETQGAGQSDYTTSDTSEKAAGGEQFELLHFKEVWLDPCLYNAYVFEEEAKLPDGTVIAKGTKLIDIKTKRGSFSDGLYFCSVGNMVLDIYPQDKAKHWTHCCYLQGDGFHGMGLNHLVPLQEQRNELRSLQFASVMRDSVSQTLIRASWIEGGKLPNKPGAVVPIVNIPDDVPLNAAVDRVRPGTGVPEAYNLDEVLSNSMTNLSGANSLANAGNAPDVKGLSTATGVMASQENANTRISPPLQLIAEMQVEQAYQILELRQANWPEEMYKSFDHEIGGDAGRWFRECNIRRDFRIEVVEGSWTPQSETRMRVDFDAYLRIVMPLVGNDPQLIKQVLKKAGDLYGRDLNIEDYNTDRVEAQIRLERLKEVATFLENESGVSVYDPSGAPAQSMVDLALEKSDLIPEKPNDCVDVLWDRHDQYQDAYTSWLRTSAGREASPYVRAVISACAERHISAATEQAQLMKAEQMKTLLPEKQAELVAGEMDFAQNQKQEAEGAAQQLQLADAAHAQQTEHAVQDAVLTDAGRRAGVLPDAKAA